jgi:hypothetical protein
MPLPDVSLDNPSFPASLPTIHTRAPLDKTPFVPVLRAMVMLLFSSEADFVDIASTH